MSESSACIQRNFKDPEHARKYAWLWLKSIERKMSEGSTEDFGFWIRALNRLYAHSQELMESGEADNLVSQHLEWLAKSSFVTDFDPFNRTGPTREVQAGNGNPTAAEFLFYLFLDAQTCDALVGDLEERYKLILDKFGQRRAKFWYWAQVVRSVGPIARAWAKKAALRPLIGVIAWAVAKSIIRHDSWLGVVLEFWRRVR